MTWKKALKTVFTHPLYLLMTFLPQLLLLMLAFPIAQNGYTIAETLMTPLLSAQWMPWLEIASPTYGDLLALALPMLGSLTLLSLANLLYRLVLEPIAVQYLGDAVTGSSFAGFAGRGLKRLWYRPVVLSILASLAMTVLFGILALLSAWSLLFSDFELIVLIITAVVSVLFMLLYMGVYFAFLSISAVEELRFFPALGKAFRLFFRRLGGFLLPSLLLLLLSAGAGFIFALHAESTDFLTSTTPALFMEGIRSILNLFMIMAGALTLISWLIGMYISAYSTHAAWERRQAELEEASKPAQPEESVADEETATAESSSAAPEEAVAPEAQSDEAPTPEEQKGETEN